MRPTLLAVAFAAGAIGAVQKPPALGVPHAADGHPSLEGMWDNSTATPLERPRDFAEKPFFSEAEARDFDTPAKAAARLRARLGDDEELVSGEANGIWRPARRLGRDRRTSLIVDPADGLMPLVPDARARFQQLTRVRNTMHPADNPEDLGLHERCLVWGTDPPLLPVQDNNIVQIVQTREAIVVAHENMHDARVIQLNGRPHLPAHMRRWTGDARGRWDGDTLVVDTTNLNAKTWFPGITTAAGSMRVLERFTRPDRGTLRYEFTVEDPSLFTRPWSGTLEMTRTDDRMFEYACHEANYSMELILRGARAREK